MKVYTKTGDTGLTRLVNETEVSKSDKRIRLLGNIDELTSNIGVVKAEINDEKMKADLENVQRNLMKMMAHIADNKNPKYFFSQTEARVLENDIDRYEQAIVRPKEFILPGKCLLSAKLDVSRTVARRAETNLAEVSKEYSIDTEAQKYLNRLSDYLYICARYIDFVDTIEQTVKKLVKKENVDTMLEKPVDMNLELSKKLIAEVEKKATSMGLNAVIAITNKAANPIAVHCMDDSFIASFDIAMNKAFTSVALKMSTLDLKELSQPQEQLYGIQNTNGGKIVIFGGGVPLVYKDKIIGGLGVSGGSEQQDSELAEYGRKIFKEVIMWQ